jgi:hypothetical protein
VPHRFGLDTELGRRPHERSRVWLRNADLARDDNGSEHAIDPDGLELVALSIGWPVGHDRERDPSPAGWCQISGGRFATRCARDHGGSMPYRRTSRATVRVHTPSSGATISA